MVNMLFQQFLVAYNLPITQDAEELKTRRSPALREILSVDCG